MERQIACPLPGAYRPATLRQSMSVLRSLGAAYWLKAVAFGLGAAIIIGIPTVLIPNPLFTREIGTTAADYIILVISALLIGVTWALPAPTPAPDAERRSLFGAVGAFIAVGCPTCNKIILILLGSSGALTYFAPIQPLLGIGAIALVITALRRRIGQLVPPGPTRQS